MESLHKYLENKEPAEVLAEMKRLKVNVKMLENNEYLFNYSDFSERGHPIVNGCRGTVWKYDSETGWQCIRSAFDRFFNYGEEYPEYGITSELPEFSKITIEEKLDGTLLFVTFRDGEFRMGTRNLSDLRKMSGIGNKNLHKVVVDILDEHLIADMIKTNDDMTFMFELCTPWNQVVVHHPEPRIVVLGARSNNFPYEEVNLNEFANPIELGDTPITYNFETLEDCQDHIKEHGGEKFEGVVLKFIKSGSEPPSFGRLKLKSADFINLSNTSSVRSSPEELMLIGLIKNDYEEILAVHPYWRNTLFPPIKKMFDEKVALIVSIQKKIDTIDKIDGKLDMKKISAEASKSPLSAFHFQKVRKSELDLREFMMLEKTTKTIIKWLTA